MSRTRGGNPQQRISAHPRNSGRELLVTNNGPQTMVRLRMRPEPGAAPTRPKEVPLAAGKATRMRPVGWRPCHIGASPLQIEVCDTVDGVAVQCFELWPVMSLQTTLRRCRMVGHSRRMISYRKGGDALAR